MKQNINLNHFQQLLFHTFTPLMNLIFFCLTKNETGAKTVPPAPKLGYNDGRALQLCARAQGDTRYVGGRRGLLYDYLRSWTRT